jgi:hypothetical protein
MVVCLPFSSTEGRLSALIGAPSSTRTRSLASKSALFVLPLRVSDEYEPNFLNPEHGFRTQTLNRAAQGVPSAILYTTTIEVAWLIFVVQILNNPLRSYHQVVSVATKQWSEVRQLDNCWVITYDL